jgi:type VI secretion system secreted protein Hcp
LSGSRAWRREALTSTPKGEQQGTGVISPPRFSQFSKEQPASAVRAARDELDAVRVTSDTAFFASRPHCLPPALHSIRDEAFKMATDYFLKLVPMTGAPAINGESTDATHQGEIEIESFSWGIHQTLNIGSQSTGAGAGKASPIELSFVTRASTASPSLIQACASGLPFNATLTIRKAGGKQEEYMKVFFTTAALSNYRSIGTSGVDIIPRDEFTLVFGTCQMEYRPQAKGGGLGAAILKGWNFIKNSAL